MFEPNKTCKLRLDENIKNMLKDLYQRTLQDFDNFNVLNPNNAFTLKTCGDVKTYQKII
jgi:hypothetical protein